MADSNCCSKELVESAELVLLAEEEAEEELVAPKLSRSGLEVFLVNETIAD